MLFTHLLIHYGEIALKGNNRSYFVSKLVHNLSSKFQALGIKVPVIAEHSHIVAVLPQAQTGLVDQACQAAATVMGVVSVAPIVRLAVSDLNTIESKVVEMARSRPPVAGHNRFAVRVKRGDKTLAFTSAQLASRLGAAIQIQTDWKKVDLTHPDRTFYVDCHARFTFFSDSKMFGPGGIPVGSSGRVLTLFSGGIDSPVAAHLMAKRGCEVDLLHFAVSRLGQKNREDHKIARLAQILSRQTGRTRLFMVSYAPFQIEVLNARVDFELMLFRRFMNRAAEQLARLIGAEALVTGDNLGQVASQTLSNLATAEQAVTLPLMRPLLTYDKNEIIDLAKKIGTFETSIEPYQDCCSLIASKPTTRSADSALTELEKNSFANYQDLIDRTLDERLTLEYVYGNLA